MANYIVMNKAISYEAAIHSRCEERETCVLQLAANAESSCVAGAFVATNRCSQLLHCLYTHSVIGIRHARSVQRKGQSM